MTYFLNYDTQKDQLSFDKTSRCGTVVTLFESYDDVGYSKNKPSVTVGDSGFTFTIETNFGYGQSSYLRFRVDYKGNTLFSFQNKRGEYSCSAPSNTFCVVPDSENWCDLFKLLAKVYNDRDIWNINECLKWLQIRNENEVIQSPILLARTFIKYFNVLDASHLGKCTPVKRATEELLIREIPKLADNLLSCELSTYDLDVTKDALSEAFTYLSSIDMMKIFIKAVRNTK